MIAGLHQIAIYANGVQPSDINVALSADDAPQLIDDPAASIAVSIRFLFAPPSQSVLASGTS